MALLKSLIQRLLDSRTTPSEASHSSYPDDGTVIQFSPSATSVSSWTKVVDSTIAPSDGYVIVRGKATGESYVQITAGDNPPHMERSTFAKTTLNQYPILNLPIAKGKTFKVFAENTAEITVGLIKSIGGGYNYLARRALSCLKPSFNFSQRSSFRTNPSGSEANPSRTQLQLGSPFNTLFLINTRLQKTGTSVLEEMLTRATLICAVHWLVLLLIQEGIYKDLSPLKKGYLSGFSARQQINNHFTLNSFLCKAANFRTGGALC